MYVEGIILIADRQNVIPGVKKELLDQFWVNYIGYISMFFGAQLIKQGQSAWFADTLN